MAIPILAPVVATIVGAVAKTVSTETLKFLATKALIIAVVGTLLPVVLYNLLNSVILEYITYAQGVIPTGDGMSSALISFTGIAGYMAIQLKLPEAFSLVMSAAALRWSLNCIPFVRI